MGTTAEKLQAVKASKEAIREALEAKGVQLGDTPLAGYAEKIGEIEVEPTSLNLDLKAIYDQYPEEPARAVYQIRKNEAADEPITFPHEGWCASKIITSDGKVYTSFPATHTWDTSKDIDETYPFPIKTRWIVVCGKTDQHLHYYAIPGTLKKYVIAAFYNLESVAFPSGITSLYYMYFGEKQKANLSTSFNQHRNLFRIPSSITTTGRTNFRSMFQYCTYITKVPNIDTSAATNTSYMFYGCYMLRRIPPLDTHNVTDMGYMFQYCHSIESIPQLDINNATTTEHMFDDCYNLRKVGKLLTPNSTRCDYMFKGCMNLEIIEELDISSVVDTANMFSSCSSLIYVRFTGLIPVSLSLSNAPRLDLDSIMSVFNALKDLTGEPAQTLTLGVSNMQKLTDEQKAIATAKNWVLN